MCYIAVLKQGVEVPEDAIFRATLSNDDGVGIAYPSAKGGVFFWRAGAAPAGASVQIGRRFERGCYGGEGYDYSNWHGGEKRDWKDLIWAIKALNEAKICSWRVLHLRAVSSGQHGVEGAHPFPLDPRMIEKGIRSGTADGILAHNGTVMHSEWFRIAVEAAMKAQRRPSQKAVWSDTAALAWAVSLEKDHKSREKLVQKHAKTYGRLVYANEDELVLAGGPWYSHEWGISNYGGYSYSATSGSYKAPAEVKTTDDKKEGDEKDDDTVELEKMDLATAQAQETPVAAPADKVEEIIQRHQGNQADLDKLPVHYRPKVVAGPETTPHLPFSPCRQGGYLTPQEALRLQRAGLEVSPGDVMDTNEDFDMGGCG